MTSMTREEFIAKAKREAWPPRYVEGMLEIVDDSEKKGIKFSYQSILSPVACPVC